MRLIRTLLCIQACSILLLANNWSPSIASGEQASPALAKVENRFVLSEPCSLLDFVRTVAKFPHTTEWLCSWYFARRSHDKSIPGSLEQDNLQIDAFKSLFDKTNNRTFKLPTGRTLDLSGKLIYDGATCEKLSELYTKCSSYLTKDELQKLKDVLDYFEPIYKMAVWQPREDGLKKQLLQFKEQAERNNLNEDLRAVQKFLDAPWIDGVPFLVVLSPLPEQTKRGHGENLDSIQVVEVGPADKFQDKAHVVFHEDVHALWFSKKNEEECRKQFRLDDKHKLPITELYEGLATALGQGWFQSECKIPKLDRWYADETINKYAHLIYPLCKQYLASGKPIDADFAHEATRIFFEKMPDISSEIGQCESFFVLAERANSQQLSGKLYKLMPRMRDFGISSPVNAKESLDRLNESDAKHVAVLVPPHKITELACLGLNDEQLKTLEQAEKFPLTLKVKERAFLFCIANDPEEQQSLLLNALSKKKWTAAK
jgi:hypothetical protein